MSRRRRQKTRRPETCQTGRRAGRREKVLSPSSRDRIRVASWVWAGRRGFRLGRRSREVECSSSFLSLPLPLLLSGQRNENDRKMFRKRSEEETDFKVNIPRSREWIEIKRMDWDQGNELRSREWIEIKVWIEIKGVD